MEQSEQIVETKICKSCKAEKPLDKDHFHLIDGKRTYKQVTTKKVVTYICKAFRNDCKDCHNRKQRIKEAAKRKVEKKQDYFYGY